jgi:protein-tyrosine kinase
MSTPSSSLIEKAAKRLEELRRAGVERDAEVPPVPAAERVPTPEAAMREHARAPFLRPAVERVAEAPELTAAAAPADADATKPRTPRRVDLDLPYLESMGFITPDAPRSQLSDEMRVIKRPLLRNASGPAHLRVRNGNLIMVTSALPGEGKTFTSINLAMSLATELDTTVLLVDGDVAHPGLPRVLGVPQSPGLLDLLTVEGLAVKDALLHTNVPNLTILPAGSAHRRATELLASEQMGVLLRDLASHYADRIIVFDSPPLLAATEARVLATQMGQVLMVVAADRTLQSEVNLALSAIDSCEVVHMMLNKAARTDVGAYYGYSADDRT